MIKCAVYNCAARADGQDEVILLQGVGSDLTFELDVEVPLCSQHREILQREREALKKREAL